MPARTLANDLSTPPAHSHAKTECLLAERMAELRKADRAAVQAAIDDLRWSARTLSTVLAKHEMDVSSSMIGKHRRMECPCFKNREAEQ